MILAVLAALSFATDSLTVDVGRMGGTLPPRGFTAIIADSQHEIAGGLSAELLRNGSFDEGLEGWVTGRAQDIKLLDAPTLNPKRKHAMRIGGTGVFNQGLEGIPVRKGKGYIARLWLRSDVPAAEVAVGLTRGGGERLANAKIRGVGPAWKGFEVTLRPKSDELLAVLDLSPGTFTVDVGFASLMPVDTYKQRAGGARKDIVERLLALRPTEVAFPIANWGESVGPPWSRGSGEAASWGLVDRILLAQDLGVRPTFIVRAKPGSSAESVVQEAVQAIRFAEAPKNTPEGQLRAVSGMPNPVEVRRVRVEVSPDADSIAESISQLEPGVEVTVPTDLVVIERPAEWFWQFGEGRRELGAAITTLEYQTKPGGATLGAALGQAAMLSALEADSGAIREASFRDLLSASTDDPNAAIQFDLIQAFTTPAFFVQMLFAQNRPDVSLPVELPLPDEPVSIRGGIGFSSRGDLDLSTMELTVDGSTGFSDLITARTAWKSSPEATLSSGTLTIKGGGRVTTVAAPLTNSRSYSLAFRFDRADKPWTIRLQTRGDQDAIECRFDPGERTVQFVKTSGGVERSLGPRATGVITLVGSRFRVEQSGFRIRLLIDERVAAEGVDEAPRSFVTVAGLDRRAKEVVLKAVNGGPNPRSVRLTLKGTPRIRTYRITVLASNSSGDFNSLQNPLNVYPRSEVVTVTDANPTVVFPAYSLVVLRIPVG